MRISGILTTISILTGLSSAQDPQVGPPDHLPGFYTFPAQCFQHRFTGGGRSLVARCWKYGWLGGKRCSEMPLQHCFAQVNGVIYPQTGGGLVDVQECILDHNTGQGNCRVWPGGKKRNEFWTAIDVGTGIVNGREGLLQCVDGAYTAPALGDRECYEKLGGDEWL